ncbi:hypothetical protein Tco_0936728 [Tanacetum coccineum]|uniref:Uncharacterized protein n=1 Tax=Tanacetum coccineum TaxID=301880 RepID=A0ABQ5DD34_9ASTR
MLGYQGDLLVPSFKTAGLGPETDHLSPSYDLLKKGPFFTRSWASRNKIARSSILGPASNFHRGHLPTSSWSSYQALRVIVSCKEDAKLACRVSMSSLIDSICSGGGTDGGVDGEGDLDLLRDEDGKSDGCGEYDDVKSDGGDDNDGISDGDLLSQLTGKGMASRITVYIFAKGNKYEGIGKGGIVYTCIALKVHNAVRILLLKLILACPRKLWDSPRVPSNRDDRNADLLQPLDISIHNFHGFFNEILRMISRTHIQTSTQSLLERLAEMRCKSAITVRYDRDQHSMS